MFYFAPIARIEVKEKMFPAFPGGEGISGNGVIFDRAFELLSSCLLLPSSKVAIALVIYFFCDVNGMMEPVDLSSRSTCRVQKVAYFEAVNGQVCVASAHRHQLGVILRSVSGD